MTGPDAALCITFDDQTMARSISSLRRSLTSGVGGEADGASVIISGGRARGINAAHTKRLLPSRLPTERGAGRPLRKLTDIGASTIRFVIDRAPVM